MKRELNIHELIECEAGMPDWASGLLCGIGLATMPLSIGFSSVAVVAGCGWGLYDAIVG